MLRPALVGICLCIGLFGDVGTADSLRVGSRIPDIRFDEQSSPYSFASGKRTVLFVYASW